MTDTRAFFDMDAEVGSEEDEDFDETGAAPKKVDGENGIDDSSEEEDEDDEDKIREVRCPLPLLGHLADNLPGRSGLCR
jgi:hypothetical protein